jgi:hypothetical protein
MGYALRREDRATVISVLQTGEYEATATSGQTALDELAHVAIELGVFEALQLIRASRARRELRRMPSASHPMSQCCRHPVLPAYRSPFRVRREPTWG